MYFCLGRTYSPLVITVTVKVKESFHMAALLFQTVQKKSP
jgi:hypothetical protein